MKLHFKDIKLLRVSLFLVLSCISIMSCEQSKIEQKITEAEMVAKFQTIELQQIVFVNAFVNQWESLFLPVGSNNSIIDSNEFVTSRVIHIGKEKLCGDYLTRAGSFSLFLFRSVNGIDSVSCKILPEDSFAIETKLGKVYFFGNIEIKILNSLNAMVASNLTFLNHNSRPLKYTSSLSLKRILKVPTTLSFGDGVELNGNSEITNQLGDVICKADVIKVTKCVDAPNFPIEGILNVIVDSKKVVNLNFDAFNNVAFDKIAKATHDKAEWIFDIQ